MVKMKMLKKGLKVENWGHRTPDETEVESDVKSDVRASDSHNTIFLA